jgi:hypothetical protein
MHIGLGIRMSGNRGAGGIFPLADVFDGTNGAAFDPNYQPSIFIDLLGETQVSATGQNVGVLLDVSRNLVLGPELAVNGAFAADSGWTKGAGWTISDGAARFTATGSFSNLSQAGTASNTAKFYKLGFDHTRAAGGFDVRFGGATAGSNVAPGIATSGAKTYRVRPRAAGGNIVFVANTTFTGTIDNVTAKEVYGTHAIGTLASDQTWNISGGVAWIDHDAGTMSVTLPDLGTDATVGYASENGITILEGQTISGATVLPDVSKLGRLFYLNRRLTALEYRNFYLWLSAKNPADILAQYAASDGTLPTAVIDIRRNYFYWSGAVKAITDLTPVSGLGYNLASSGILNNSAGTTFIEWTTPDSGSFAAAESLFSFCNTVSADRFVVSLGSGNKGQPTFAVDTPLASLVSLTSAVVHPFPLFGRRKVGVRYNAAATYKLIEDGMVADNTASASVYDAISFNRITIGHQQIAGSTGQPCTMLDSLCLVYFNTALSDSVMEATAKKSIDGPLPIHVLGDSISNERPYPDGGGAWARIKSLAANNGYFAFSWSVVGGTNLEQFATRFTADAEHQAANVVIYEGGLDFESVDEVAGLNSILALIPHERYVLVEPIKASDMPTGSAKRTDHEAAWAALVAVVGADKVITTHEAMKAANDGSAGDLEDVANDICPRSLREDGIHPNQAGQDVLAATIYAKLAARGWMF